MRLLVFHSPYENVRSKIQTRRGHISYVHGRSFEQNYLLLAYYLDQTIHNILIVMPIS
jgi:hypothetical protein